MGGIMDLTGEPAGSPQKPGVAYADLFTGLYAVIAIQAALLQRQNTGQGSQIDLALLDTQVAVLANQSLNYLVSGVAPQRLGNAHPNLVPYQLFKVADGELVIAVGNDTQFRRLTEVLGITALADEPIARRNEDRVRHRAAVVARVQAETLRFTRSDLAARLTAAGVPAGSINTVADVFADPQVQARGLLQQAALAGGGSVPAVRLPIRMTGLAGGPRAASPRLGAHNDEIIAQIRLKDRSSSGGHSDDSTE
jgi:crotonobetainyl-CoA:carnitine CoA-transferase CaiB-like acyl-CoA transferase